VAGIRNSLGILCPTYATACAIDYPERAIQQLEILSDHSFSYRNNNLRHRYPGVNASTSGQYGIAVFPSRSAMSIGSLKRWSLWVVAVVFGRSSGGCVGGNEGEI